MMDFRQNLHKFHQYVRALEDERRKIQMFQRELPLCLQIVTQAIETYKQQISGTSTATTTTNAHSDCSEQTTSDAPVFEEFMPIKRGSSSAGGSREEDENDAVDDDTELQSHNKSPDFDNNDKYGSEKKSDWLSLNSVQLWNQSPDLPSTATNKEVHQMSQPRKVQVVEVKGNGGGAFHPFQKDNSDFTPAAIPAPAPAGSASSSAERACQAAGKKEEGGQARKARRCWSPELHRRFLNALEQLGGSHAATPKQIRDLMKVDGLTNDEVKSHLQKYRLHSRRPASAVHSNTSTQAPQFVVVGGIWVPPGGAATTPGQPQKKQPSQSAGSSHSEGGCNSGATSSSTHGIAPSAAQ